MLPPAASVAGSVPAFTLKVALDVLNSAIWTAEVPLFVMATFRYTGVPTFTSPKSTVEGLTTSAGVPELVEEKGLVSDPHPVRPRLIPIAATERAITAPVARLFELFFLLDTPGRTGWTFSSIAKDKILRNANIGITCASGIWRSKSANAASPPHPANGGIDVYAALVTISRIVLAEAAVQVTIVTNGS
jgi:hypothetical protein